MYALKQSVGLDNGILIMLLILVLPSNDFGYSYIRIEHRHGNT